MKGQKTITVDGEKIKLKFTVGALEDFQEYIDSLDEDLDVDSAMGKMKYARVLLQIMSLYGEGDIKEELDLDKAAKDSVRFKMAGVADLMDGVSLVHEAVGDLPESVGNGQIPVGKGK